MEVERQVLISALVHNRSAIEAALWTTKTNSKQASKSAELSEKARLEGNALYSRRGGHGEGTHAQVFECYCRSVALAPSGSETLALAYGNRSAFLLHVGKFGESLQDIDRALRLTAMEGLKVKLLCRKAECLKAMGSGSFKGALTEAERCLEKISREHAKRQELERLLSKLKEMKIHEAKSAGDKDERSKVSEILSKKESSDFRKAVDINWNKKYGRHLVAARDFQPGEIVFVEKIYVTFLNSRKNYTNCCYCLKTCWSGIPCECCSWAMFCSEKCRKKAWVESHDIECSIFPLLSILDRNLMSTYRICVRMMIKGIKEAGSISKLRDHLTAIDKCSDVYRGFIENEKLNFHTFKSIYTLNSDLIVGRDLYLELFSNSAVGVLICLIMKNSSFFGKDFKLNEIEDLMRNEDAIFLGSLLIKLFGMKKNNSHAFSHLLHECELQNDLATCKLKRCCDTATSVTPLASLINHSCIPNVSRCFTEDRKIICYVLQPIKKNSQIFDNYNSIFYHKPVVERHKDLKSYNFICDCIACLENWPPLFTQAKFQKHQQADIKEIIYTRQSLIETKLFQDCKSIFKALDDGKTNFDQNTIKKLSKNIVKATANLKQPNEVFCLLIEALNEIFPKIYGIRRESFGDCRNV